MCKYGRAGSQRLQTRYLIQRYIKIKKNLSESNETFWFKHKEVLGKTNERHISGGLYFATDRNQCREKSILIFHIFAFENKICSPCHWTRYWITKQYFLNLPLQERVLFYEMTWLFSCLFRVQGTRELWRRSRRLTGLSWNSTGLYGPLSSISIWTTFLWR